MMDINLLLIVFFLLLVMTLGAVGVGIYKLLDWLDRFWEVRRG